MGVLSTVLLSAQLYQVAPDYIVWLGSFRELGPERFLLDFATRRFAPATPEDLRRLDGATIIPSRTEVVSFRNQDVRLAGKLALPATPSPHPAVVLIHGSNDQDRDFLDPWVGFFVSQGLAVLSYDKRGVRESTGDWKRSDFEDLAGDVLAGIGLLRRHEAIDPRRIGVFGISQGGWIAPLVAARDSGVAFIILHAGSALRVAENNLRFIEAELSGYGFAAAEIAQAMEYYRLNDEVTRDAKRWPDLQALFAGARQRKVEWLIEDPQRPDHWFRGFYRRVMDFDPAPYWERVSCPVLAFLGTLDHNVPAEPNRRAFETLLGDRRESEFKLVVLPHANHLFLEAVTGTREEYATLDHFVPGYFEVMAAWLAEHVNPVPPR